MKACYEKFSIKDTFRCPKCSAPLSLSGQSLLCENGHCFDIAKKGYVNLALGRGGSIHYDKALFESRGIILKAGLYGHILAAASEALLETAPKRILDAGCGEGYYARALAAAGAEVYAFDLSKDAVALAAEGGTPVKLMVADMTAIPLLSGSMDAILDAFSPAHYGEYERVLKKGGRIVNISSVAGVFAIPFQAWYSISKAAVRSLTMALYNEVAPYGIQVTSVMPGDIKTGFTSAAGYCFVGAAEKDGIELISVVFYTTENGRWTDTKKLMEYGFSQFVSMTPQELYLENPITVETSGFSLDDAGYGRLELGVQAQTGSRAVYIVATKDEMASMARNLRQTVLIEYSRDFIAPITQGEVMGTMTYYPENGGSPVVYDLVASRSIDRREDAPLSLEEIEALVYADPNPFPPMSVEFAMMLFLPVAGVFLAIRLLWRLTHKTTAKKRKKTSLKPQNRFYR